LILEGVDHFQVVFTVPQQLSRLSLGNREAIYNLLMRSSWSALKKAIIDEHGFEPAAQMVLHTWNQKLDAHSHVHAVVPACGLSVDNETLAWAQKGDDSSTRGKYLVDPVTLRALYRKKFLAGLNRLYRRGLLKLTGEFEYLQQPDAWQAFVDQLQQTDWVSHITAPPAVGQSADQVLKYLARYLGGGPIADSRILSTDSTNVTFLARDGMTTGGDRKQKPLTLTQLEFTRRWSLHILPSGFIRTRRYGYWSNRHCQQSIERIAICLEDSELPLYEDALQFEPSCYQPCSPETIDQTAAEAEGQLKSPECHRCKTRLIPHRISPKPSWAVTMSSPNRPQWYKPSPRPISGSS